MINLLGRISQKNEVDGAGWTVANHQIAVIFEDHIPKPLQEENVLGSFGETFGQTWSRQICEG